MITGHTDSDPVKHSRKKGIEDNRHLSVMRALNVLEEMKKHGYPGELLYPTGWGELRPVSSNDSKQGKARNRRVEIYIDPAASGFFSNVAITDVARPVGGYDGEGPVITSGTATLE
jgi:chemotaxis protein MotB